MMIEPDTDVLIVGAGISGIGAAASLTIRRSSTRFSIIEARGAIGGTWDLFRYPGVRSDSDLYTFGYDFKPWKDENSIASADRILAYLKETVAEYHLEQHLQFDRRVISSDWDSATSLWTTRIERTDTAEREEITSRWVFCASGYYRYDQGYTPDLPGLNDFAGQVIHPQHWPAGLDWAGKRVLVLGSGATAVTLVPALAKTAAHVAMLQRTPSYVLPLPAKDVTALRLRRLLGDKRAYPLIRWKNVTKQRLIWQVSRRRPDLMRRFIRWANIKSLPEGYPVDTHFNPPYQPWDQRLCFVPDGDFFTALRDGAAEIVTDRIRTFGPSGVTLESGRGIEADIVVTATGLNVQPLGALELSIDGHRIDISQRITFKGMMLSGIPNFAYAIGYTNASWTLKIGLLCEHFCRILDHMDSAGYSSCTPVAPDGMQTRPLLDFAAGYILRVVGSLPRQGDRAPWATSADYPADARLFRSRPVTDPNLEFRSSSGASVMLPGEAA